LANTTYVEANIKNKNNKKKAQKIKNLPKNGIVEVQEDQEDPQADNQAFDALNSDIEKA
jgi:hypothetical protein